MTYIKDYLSAFQDINGEFKNISLQSPPEEVCKAAKKSQDIISAFAIKYPDDVSDLRQVYYIIAKQHLPQALKNLEARIHTQNEKLSQVVEGEDVKELFDARLTVEADALIKQHEALTALFKETLELAPTCCWGLGWIYRIINYFTYSSPVQKQIDKVEAALSRLQLLEGARKQKKAEFYRVPEEEFSRELDAFEKDVIAFEKMVLDYKDVIFPTNFIDTYNKLQRQEMSLSRKLEKLKSIDKDPEQYDKFNKQQYKHFQIFIRLSNLYDAMDVFQSLHRGIQYHGLDMLAIGDEEIDRRRAACQRIISPEQIEKALVYPFAWKKLTEFANFELRFLLDKFSGDSSQRTYIKKLKLLSELIPQFQSKLISDAVMLETVLAANEQPKAVVDTQAPPSRVKATAPLSPPVEQESPTIEKGRFKRFIDRVFS